MSFDFRGSVLNLTLLGLASSKLLLISSEDRHSPDETQNKAATLQEIKKLLDFCTKMKLCFHFVYLCTSEVSSSLCATLLSVRMFIRRALTL